MCTIVRRDNRERTMMDRLRHTTALARAGRPTGVVRYAERRRTIRDVNPNRRTDAVQAPTLFRGVEIKRWFLFFSFCSRFVFSKTKRQRKKKYTNFASYNNRCLLRRRAYFPPLPPRPIFGDWISKVTDVLVRKS